MKATKEGKLLVDLAERFMEMGITPCDVPNEQGADFASGHLMLIVVDRGGPVIVFTPSTPAPLDRLFLRTV